MADAADAPIPHGLEFVPEAPARAPPRSIDPDPGGRQRLVSIRSTILLI